MDASTLFGFVGLVFLVMIVVGVVGSRTTTRRDVSDGESARFVPGDSDGHDGRHANGGSGHGHDDAGWGGDSGGGDGGDGGGD